MIGQSRVPGFGESTHSRQTRADGGENLSKKTLQSTQVSKTECQKIQGALPKNKPSWIQNKLRKFQTELCPSSSEKNCTSPIKYDDDSQRSKQHHALSDQSTRLQLLLRRIESLQSDNSKLCSEKVDYEEKIHQLKGLRRNNKSKQSFNTTSQSFRNFEQMKEFESYQFQAPELCALKASTTSIEKQINHNALASLNEPELQTFTTINSSQHQIIVDLKNQLYEKQKLCEQIETESSNQKYMLEKLKRDHKELKSYQSVLNQELEIVLSEYQEVKQELQLVRDSVAEKQSGKNGHHSDSENDTAAKKAITAKQNSIIKEQESIIDSLEEQNVRVNQKLIEAYGQNEDLHEKLREFSSKGVQQSEVKFHEEETRVHENSELEEDEDQGESKEVYVRLLEEMKGRQIEHKEKIGILNKEIDCLKKLISQYKQVCLFQRRQIESQYRKIEKVLAKAK